MWQFYSNYDRIVAEDIKNFEIVHPNGHPQSIQLEHIRLVYFFKPQSVSWAEQEVLYVRNFAEDEGHTACPRNWIVA